MFDEGADAREVKGLEAMLVDELDRMGRLVDDLTTHAWADDRALRFGLRYRLRGRGRR